MKLRAVKLLRLAALAVKTEIGGGLMPRINRALRIAPLALCVALVLGAAGMANASLPSGYTEYTYIWGDGASGRILLDDYTPTPNDDKIEAVASFPSGSLYSSQIIWCSRTSGNIATWTLWVLQNSTTVFMIQPDYGNSAGTRIKTPTVSATDVKYTFTFNGPEFTWSAGASQTFTKVADYTAGGPVMLFARYSNGVSNNLGSYGKFKLYSFKVWRSDALIHDLVPAVRNSDTAKGLYDVKAGKFYAGEGTFTMGEEVESLNDTLEIASSLDGIGSPSPVYGVTNGLAASDSFIVSCGTTPVMDAVGRLQYSCTGWKLYDEADAVVSSGDGTSFTYIHPNPAAYRRLEWQWELTASYSETWYNTRVNNGNDTSVEGTCLVGNPGLWTNSLGEAATQFITNDTYVVSGGQTLRMGNVAGLRRFAGGTMQFGRNGTAGILYYEHFNALSFPYGLILDRGSIYFSYYNGPEQARIGGVLNGGRITVTASEQNPFSMSAAENRIVVINNDLATESDSNVLSIGGTAVKCVYFVMGDLSGYTGRIVANGTSSSDVRWATRLCLGNRTMPGTIQVKGKAAISAWSGVLTNPGNNLDLPIRSPSVCTIGSLVMEAGSVICVEGSNKTSTKAATNGLIRVGTAFSASRPVYVQPSWAFEVTKENPDVTVLTVPASQELSKADFTLDTTGLELPQELILDVRSEGPVKKLVITKKGIGLTIFVR